MTTLLTFTTPSGAEIEVRPIDGSRGEHVTLTVEADTATWETIDLVMFFNLRWDVRGEGTITGNTPVQLVLRLDSALADQLPDGEVAAALARLDLAHPLRSNTNWYALEVTEAVDLPPSLAEKGELRSGFGTTWMESTGGNG
ncbi:hypothetical protein BH23ACT3_BH23ACT3_18890 [soil metagenome]